MSMHSRSDQACTRSMQTHSHLNQHTIKEIGNTEKDILCGKKHLYPYVFRTLTQSLSKSNRNREKRKLHEYMYIFIYQFSKSLY